MCEAEEVYLQSLQKHLDYQMCIGGFSNPPSLDRQKWDHNDQKCKCTHCAGSCVVLNCGLKFENVGGLEKYAEIHKGILIASRCDQGEYINLDRRNLKLHKRLFGEQLFE